MRYRIVFTKYVHSAFKEAILIDTLKFTLADFDIRFLKQSK